MLRIARDPVSARELAALAGQVTGRKFRLLRAGNLGTLEALIKILRRIAPGKNQLYPIWQQMQYMRDMFDGRAKLKSLDNGRYPGIGWTTVRELPAAYGSAMGLDGLAKLRPAAALEIPGGDW